MMGARNCFTRHCQQLFKSLNISPGCMAKSFSASEREVPESSSSSPIHARTDVSYLSAYQAPTPVLQIGPRCGFVALAMAADILLGTSCCDDELIQIAKSKGVTKQGEMFSAASMCELVNEHLGCTARIVNLREAFCELLEALLHGDLAIVPYDADGNHEPCLKRGHKAHWALIAGCIIPMTASLRRHIPESMLRRDPVCPNLAHCTRFSGKSSSNTLNGTAHVSQTICDGQHGMHGNNIEKRQMQVDDHVRNPHLGEPDAGCILSNKPRMCNERNKYYPGNNSDSGWSNNDNIIYSIVTHFYTQESRLNTQIISENMTELGEHLSTMDPRCIRVFAHHGKSRHVGTWWLDKLIESNDNLVEVSPDIQNIPNDYVIPSGGINGGLCGKVVIVSRRSKEVDIV